MVAGKGIKFLFMLYERTFRIIIHRSNSKSMILTIHHYKQSIHNYFFKFHGLALQHFIKRFLTASVN